MNTNVVSLNLGSVHSLRSQPRPALNEIPLEKVDEPTYIIDAQRIRQNMAIIDRVQREANCEVLLALKGFSTFDAFDLMTPTLAGCCASGLWEARLAAEKFGKQVHAYSPAFSPSEFEQILNLSDHITFNSMSQWSRYKDACATKPSLQTGLRINPEFSTGEVALYDPCAPYSRLGVKANQLPLPRGEMMQGITGFHCHTLCQQTTEPLEKTMRAIEERFAEWLPHLSWFNFGGGHHITREDYDVDHLISLVRDFSDRWQLRVYLEPGEAHVYNAGYLVATVLDVIENGMQIALLNVSATAHMPDVLEMPYRPPVRHSGLANEKAHTYRLGSNSCLSGDVIGDYSFDQPLQIGDKVVFEDQAQYTMVKSNYFNGVQHPSIVIWDAESDDYQRKRQFHYEDFINRLG